MKDHPKTLRCRVDKITDRVADLVFTDETGWCIHCHRMSLKLAREIKKRWDASDPKKTIK